VKPRGLINRRCNTWQYLREEPQKQDGIKEEPIGNWLFRALLLVPAAANLLCPTESARLADIIRVRKLSLRLNNSILLADREGGSSSLFLSFCKKVTTIRV